MRNILTKLSKRVEDTEDFIVFDTETTLLSPQPRNFVFGVVFDGQNHTVIYSVDDFRKEFLKEKYKGKRIFAHNAEFDLMTLYGNIYKNLDNAAIYNGCFIAASNGNCTFYDSFNIYKTSVKKIGKAIGVEKLDDDKVRDNKLTKKNITQFDIDYCKRDCEIIYIALKKMFVRVGRIKSTMASLAMTDFRRNYLTHNIYYNNIYTDKFFDGYKGGRTEAFILGDVKLHSFDINSMYPYNMKNGLYPQPDRMKEIKPTLKQFLYILDRYEGQAYLTVKHKDTYIGYLPLNIDNKLVFPTGTFKGCFVFPEIRKALYDGVIEILDIESVIYSQPQKSIFSDYIDDHYEKKSTSEGIDIIIEKNFLNTLYGKFAQQLKKRQRYFEYIPLDFISELNKKGLIYELKYFSEHRTDLFIEVLEQSLSMTTIPSYASYVTSNSRVCLLDGLINNQNQAGYCDTDSIFSGEDFNGKIGMELGDWKKEKKFVTEIRGLKNYDCIEEGEMKRHIKGISSKYIETEKNIYEGEKYLKTKESLRRNKEAGEIVPIEKKLKHKYDKRIIESNGKNTRPININL